MIMPDSHFGTETQEEFHLSTSFFKIAFNCIAYAPTALKKKKVLIHIETNSNSNRVLASNLIQPLCDEQSSLEQEPSLFWDLYSVWQG